MAGGLRAELIQVVKVNSAGNPRSLRVGVASAGALALLMNGARAPAATQGAIRAPTGNQSIPAGEFVVGSSDDRARADEQPAHRVGLSHPSFIDQTEATNAQFGRFTKAISYRTVAEWERAARGGVDGRPYVWDSDQPNDSGSEGWFANIWNGSFPSRNTAVDGYAGTAPVRQFKPNPDGLPDMAGNAWEWPADWCDADAFAACASLLVTDPAGPAQALTREYRRVRRGSSFLCHKSYCSRYCPGARQGATADSGSSHAEAGCAQSAGKGA